MGIWCRVLCVIAAVLCLAGCGDSPGARAKRYEESFRKADVQTAMALTSPRYLAEVGEDTHRVQVKELCDILAASPVPMEAPDVSVLSQDVRGDSATVTLKFKWRQSEGTRTVSMVRINKVWYVEPERTPKGQMTRMAMARVFGALLFYHLRHKEYPKALADLVPDFGRLASDFKDEWSRDLRYERRDPKDERHFALISAGPDGEFATGDDIEFTDFQDIPKDDNAKPAPDAG